jgi:hypothetical protein
VHDIVSDSQSRSPHCVGCAGEKSGLPHVKRWNCRRMRGAKSLCTTLNARTHFLRRCSTALLERFDASELIVRRIC